MLLGEHIPNESSSSKPQTIAKPNTKTPTTQPIPFQNGTHSFTAFSKKHLEKKGLAAQRASQEADAELACARNAVNACAFSSHCASDWFKCTGILPEKQGGDSDSPFLKTVYLPDGQPEMFIRRRNIVASGLYGEYRAFNLLSGAIDMGEFSRACLLYNALIPKIHESRKSNRARYAQVDFLLITQRAA